ncbi:hypothetical protein PHYPSEUDO_012026 [Phytophthora pseudosyringae]|uniref:RxLR effector protein n=1 Tax=Phytophthora pseudosyringae TaxID=221518 RepID=A0A8T1VAU2_9STRA|nr:hypothetical protein PHYPSEUDO_012026 [Phytophthora pseudosyringae]
MRLSLVLLVAATLTLWADSNARSADTMTHPHLRQKATSSDVVEGTAENEDGQTSLRLLKNVEIADDREDSEEERGFNKFPTLEKLKALRKVERIMEVKEALAHAKGAVKAAAEAAAKDKRVEAISAQLDDATVKSMLKDPKVNNAVFDAWHQAKLDPQLVFNAFALRGKFTNAKWDGIANAYLDYATKMALAAAKAT